MACNSGIYLMALGGVHLLEGAGKSWYLLRSAWNSSKPSVQVQAVQRKENRFMSKREITAKDSEARGGAGVEIVQTVCLSSMQIATSTMTYPPLQAGEPLQGPSSKYLSCKPCFSENSRPFAH